jgi:hypothetical protein
MGKYTKPAVKRVAKATAVGMMAGGLLLGGSAGMASADAGSALASTVEKAVVAGSATTQKAVVAGATATEKAAVAGSVALNRALRGLLGG